MINKLHIQNFQSHKNSILEFDPGVNIITGTSDSGKSAIIRALKLIVQNKPDGDAYRSNWGGKTLIQAVFDNCSVERERDKENIYRLNGSEYKAIGSGVPTDITTAININDINLQQQHDKPFLISNTAGEVAHHFNSIAHLEQIDATIKKVNQWQKSINVDLKSKANLIITLQEDKAVYEGLDSLETEIEVLEDIEQQNISIIQKKRLLNTLMEDITEVENQIEAESFLLTVKEPTELLLTSIEELNKLEGNKTNLLEQIKSIERIEHKITFNSQLVSLAPDIDVLQDAYIKYNKLDENIIHLIDLLDDINKKDTQIKHHSAKLKENKEIYNRNMPDICPLCNSKIKHETH